MNNINRLVELEKQVMLLEKRVENAIAVTSASIPDFVLEELNDIEDTVAKIRENLIEGVRK